MALVRECVLVVVSWLSLCHPAVFARPGFDRAHSMLPWLTSLSKASSDELRATRGVTWNVSNVPPSTKRWLGRATG